MSTVDLEGQQSRAALPPLPGSEEALQVDGAQPSVSRASQPVPVPVRGLWGFRLQPRLWDEVAPFPSQGPPRLSAKALQRAANGLLVPGCPRGLAG